MNRILLCAPVALAGLIPAQRVHWNLEAHQAAKFERSESRQVTVLEPAGGTVTNALTARLQPGPRNPPLLLGGELDAKRQFLRAPFFDARDLAAWVAFDLRTGKRSGKRRFEMPGRPAFAAFVIEARYGKIETDGEQVVACTIETLTDKNDKKRRRPRRRAAPAGPTRHQFSGTLSITRRVDLAKQRISAFSSKLRLDVAVPERVDAKIRRFRIEHEEDWIWMRDVEHGDGEFRSGVAAALRAGIDVLRGSLKGMKGGQFAEQNGKRHAFGSGRLALVLLALLKAGEDPRDELVREALDELRRREILDSYSLAAAIMALESLYAPPDERDMLIDGRLQGPVTRKPTAQDTELLTEWTKRLLTNIDTSVDKAYLRRWHYHQSKSYDNSNTQYALLGLYAATLCGVEISPQVWTAAAAHWLDSQGAPEGKPRALKIVTHREEKTKKKTRTASRGVRSQARGWGYRKGTHATGSMTAAGVTGLSLCTAALTAAKKREPKLRMQANQAVTDGFAWLAENFTVRANPNAENAWPYYYLYGVERSCEISSIARLQGRDWYFEGAMQLLGQQNKGSWGSLDRTCFAILFLKKAALPAITGR